MPCNFGNDVFNPLSWEALLARGFSNEPIGRTARHEPIRVLFSTTSAEAYLFAGRLGVDTSKASTKYHPIEPTPRSASL